jgi:hypothetical protein
MVVVPALTGRYDPPEWTSGFFVAAPAVFGVWLAAKTDADAQLRHRQALAALRVRRSTR